MSESIPQDGPIHISRITPKGLLSFGSEFSGVDLQSLNVLIGPNGSGKSNLIETIALLRAIPVSVEEHFLKCGGFEHWCWKGLTPLLSPSLAVDVPTWLRAAVLHHSLQFGNVPPGLFFVSEERITKTHGQESPAEEYVQDLAQARPKLLSRDHDGVRTWVELPEKTYSKSVLALIRDSVHFPELSSLTNTYERIRIYREWTFGRNAVFRVPQKADMRSDSLNEDFSNLGMVLNRLKATQPAAKRAILTGLQVLYEGITDFNVLIQGGSVQVFFTEGEFVIPATRLSDGTLRYLCLLAILCDPTPPPMVCIEEPELGLHPDVLPSLADLLKEAAMRTQIIVTTHSDILVDAMSDRLESIIICEKHNGQTEMTRLSSAELVVWLGKYRLGQLWLDGQIGGKRW
jgi:predicted ATPase